MTIMTNDAKTITSMFESPEAAQAAVARRNEIVATLDQLRRELTALDDVLDSTSATTHVVSGVPLHVDDTTTRGGRYVSVFPVVWSRDRRSAEVCAHARTGEWMLILKGAECRSGGEIVKHSSDKDALIEEACRWAATGR